MTPDDHRRLLKIVGLLASPNDGERASAAQRATELLRRNALTWEDAVSGIALRDIPSNSDLFILDDVAMARNDLAVSEALRTQLADELEAAKARLDEV